MKTPLGTEVDLSPGHIVLGGIQAPANGAQQPPRLFGPCLLWPRSTISATDELLLSTVSIADRLSNLPTDLCVAAMLQDGYEVRKGLLCRLGRRQLQ